MQPAFKNRFHRLDEFIRLVQAGKDRPADYDPRYHYDIYLREGQEFDPLDETMQIYVGDGVQVDDDDREIYPDFVLRNGYAFSCSDEILQGVVDLAFRQKPDAPIADVIRCLNHYLSKDTFLDLE